MIYTDIFGDLIELTDERWFHIAKEHPMGCIPNLSQNSIVIHG